MQTIDSSFRRVAACILCLGMLLMALCPAALAESDTVKTVKVGFFAFPGYHVRQDDGSVPRGSGYGSDFLQLLRRYANLNFEYVGYDKTRRDMPELLRSGEIDLFTLATKTGESSSEFAFSQPIGRTYTEITVRIEDGRYESGEYSDFDGMVIGTVEGYDFINNLSDFAQEKGFSYSLKIYDTEEAMVSALMNAEVDGLVYGSMRSRPGEKRIARFAPEEYFVAVRKEDTWLLDEINYGIEQMDFNEGDWRNELHYQYFGEGAVSSDELFFTQREKDYIAAVQSGEKVITACAQIDRDPYSWPENGKMVGIIPEYFDYLMSMAGLPYTVMIAGNREQHQQWTLNNYVDVYMDARRTGTTVLQDWMGIDSESYMQLTTSRVTKRDFAGEIRTVAVTGSQGLKGIDDQIVAQDAEVVLCDTRESAMQAVKEGKADACYVYTYMAEKFVNSDSEGNLVAHIMNSPVYDMRFYIRPSTDHELISILNKCLKADQSHMLDELVDKYTKFEQTDVTIAQFVRKNPWFVTALATVFLLAIAFILLLILSNRRISRINQELAVSMKNAQSANIAKTTFLNNMSHDIRTPMNAIIGFTNIALKQQPKPEVQNCLEKIGESSEHLLTLINDVLDISRIESGKTRFCPTPVDITSVTDAVLDITKGFLINRDLTFTVSRVKLNPPYVLADAVRIREVLVNILSNAVKFTDDGGSIRFEASFRPGADEKHIVVRYVISDTGVGMSRDFMKHIFEEFAQENSDARTQYKGTGLGMAITKQYVELMGGTISVESEKGVGSTFTVELEMELTDEESACRQEQPISRTNLNGVKVLLAEDNDLNAEIAQLQLEECGMQVTRAVDGREAVELFESHPAGAYDVILMDIMMPEMSGYDATRAIRSLDGRPDGRAIPIIAMTANAFAEDVQASLDAGMNSHLSKPIVMEEVVKTIARNLNR